MVDPTISDIDIKYKLISVWTTLKFFRYHFIEITSFFVDVPLPDPKLFLKITTQEIYYGITGN